MIEPDALDRAALPWLVVAGVDDGMILWELAGRPDHFETLLRRWYNAGWLIPGVGVDDGIPRVLATSEAIRVFGGPLAGQPW